MGRERGGEEKDVRWGRERWKGGEGEECKLIGMRRRVTRSTKRGEEERRGEERRRERRERENRER